MNQTDKDKLCDSVAKGRISFEEALDILDVAEREKENENE